MYEWMYEWTLGHGLHVEGAIKTHPNVVLEKVKPKKSMDHHC